MVSPQEVDTSSQLGDMVMFRLKHENIADVKKWQHLNYQCRGMIFDINWENCLFYGLDHFSMKHNLPPSTWPLADEKQLNDNTNRKYTQMTPVRYVYIFPSSFDNKLIICNERELKDEEAEKFVEQNKLDLSRCDFERYHHIFQLYYHHAVEEGGSRQQRDHGTQAHLRIYLVALRLSFSYELVVDQQMLVEYGEHVGVPVLHQ